MKAYIIRQETSIMQELDLASTDRIAFPPGATLISEGHMAMLEKELGNREKVLATLKATADSGRAPIKD